MYSTIAKYSAKPEIKFLSYLRLFFDLEFNLAFDDALRFFYISYNYSYVRDSHTVGRFNLKFSINLIKIFFENNYQLSRYTVNPKAFKR